MTFSSVLGVCRQTIEHIETMGKQGLTVLIFPSFFFLSFFLACFLLYHNLCQGFSWTKDPQIWWFPFKWTTLPVLSSLHQGQFCSWRSTV